MRNQNYIYHRVLIVPSAVLAGLMLEWCYQRRIHVEIQTPEGQLEPAVLAFASDDRRRAAVAVARARLGELRLHPGAGTRLFEAFDRIKSVRYAGRKGSSRLVADTRHRVADGSSDCDRE
jgi:hypothetical protein